MAFDAGTVFSFLHFWRVLTEVYGYSFQACDLGLFGARYSFLDVSALRLLPIGLHRQQTVGQSAFI